MGLQVPNIRIQVVLRYQVVWVKFEVRQILKNEFENCIEIDTQHFIMKADDLRDQSSNDSLGKVKKCWVE